MSNNVVLAVDIEMQQFQEDLLQSVNEFKAGKFARVTKFETEVADNAVTVKFLDCRLMKECK